MPTAHDPSSLVEWALVTLRSGSLERSGIRADRARWKPDIDKVSQRWFSAVQDLANRRRLEAPAKQFLRVVDWIGGVRGWEMVMRSEASRLTVVNEWLFEVLGPFVEDPRYVGLREGESFSIERAKAQAELLMLEVCLCRSPSFRWRYSRLFFSKGNDDFRRGGNAEACLKYRLASLLDRRSRSPTRTSLLPCSNARLSNRALALLSSRRCH